MSQRVTVAGDVVIMKKKENGLNVGIWFITMEILLLAGFGTLLIELVQKSTMVFTAIECFITLLVILVVHLILIDQKAWSR